MVVVRLFASKTKQPCRTVHVSGQRFLTQPLHTLMRHGWISCEEFPTRSGTTSWWWSTSRVTRDHSCGECDRHGIDFLPLEDIQHPTLLGDPISRKSVNRSFRMHLLRYSDQREQGLRFLPFCSRTIDHDQRVTAHYPLTGESLDRTITEGIAESAICCTGQAYFVHVDHTGLITLGGPHPVNRPTFDTPLNVASESTLGIRHDANDSVDVTNVDHEAILRSTPETYLEPIRKELMDQAVENGIELVLE